MWTLDRFTLLVDPCWDTDTNLNLCFQKCFASGTDSFSTSTGLTWMSFHLCKYLFISCCIFLSVKEWSLTTALFESVVCFCLWSQETSHQKEKRNRSCVTVTAGFSLQGDMRSVIPPTGSGSRRDPDQMPEQPHLKQKSSSFPLIVYVSTEHWAAMLPAPSLH